MKQIIFAVVIISAFIALLSLAVTSLINNGFNFFDVLIIIITILGLTEITYKYIKRKRNN